MFGIVGIVDGDAVQVEHAAGRGAAQGTEKTNGTVLGHGKPRNAFLKRPSWPASPKDFFTEAAAA
jgi:hypothetical protein